MEDSSVLASGGRSPSPPAEAHVQQSGLAGCVAVMTATILAYVPRGPEPGWIPVVGNVHLWLGALCFFIGAILLMRESCDAASR